MEQEWTLLGRVLCKWLKCHLPEWGKHWHHEGKLLTWCRGCRKIDNNGRSHFVYSDYHIGLFFYHAILFYFTGIIYD